MIFNSTTVPDKDVITKKMLVFVFITMYFKAFKISAGMIVTQPNKVSKLHVPIYIKNFNVIVACFFGMQISALSRFTIPSKLCDKDETRQFWTASSQELNAAKR